MRLRGIACLACVWSAISTAQDAAPFARHAFPPPGDFIAELIAERTGRVIPSESPLHDDVDVERLSLVDPANLYSELAPLNTATMDTTWHGAWTSMTRRGFTMSLLQTQTSFRWDLGLTRARPGIEMPPLRAVSELGKPWVAANIVKAGIDLDLYIQARLLAGPGHELVAANLAVAAQLLRGKIEQAQTSGETYTGLWSVPLERVVAARRAYALSEVEIAYLMRLLENELASWRARPLSVYGRRQVSAAVRVARAAAAYRSETYAEPFPCSDNGSVVSGVAATTLDDTTGAFCFADMIDRRVLAWYGTALRDDLAAKIDDPDVMVSGAGPLIEAVDRLRPAWLGAFVGGIQDPTLGTDVVAATIGRELAWRGSVSPAALTALEELAVERMCRGSAL